MIGMIVILLTLKVNNILEMDIKNIKILILILLERLLLYAKALNSNLEGDCYHRFIYYNFWTFIFHLFFRSCFDLFFFTIN